MDSPSADDVRTQLERLHTWKGLRGPKLKRLLDFIVQEWLAGRSERLTLRYIGDSLQHEPLTFEEESSQFSYPKTRAILAYLRKRLLVFNETVGYDDRTIIRACSHYPQGFDNEGEREEAKEENIEFFKA